MTIKHIYSQTVADGTATSVVRPSDWNSNHNMVFALSGNTIGSSQVSGQDVVFVGGNNMTLSADTANSNIVFSAGAGGGVTLTGYDPFPVGARSTQSIGQSSLAIYPFAIDDAMTYNNVVQYVQMTCVTSSVAPVTNSTATTGSTGSMSAGQTVEFYLYSRGSGGYSTNLYTAGTT